MKFNKEIHRELFQIYKNGCNDITESIFGEEINKDNSYKWIEVNGIVCDMINNFTEYVMEFRNQIMGTSEIIHSRNIVNEGLLKISGVYEDFVPDEEFAITVMKISSELILEINYKLLDYDIRKN